MKFDCLSLGDHLPDPRTKRYSDTQAERHRMWVSLGIRAEELGFSGVFLGEHHCSDYILSSPQLVLSAIAFQTNRIRLGTAVSLLPNCDPVRLAEDFATLDLLSNGRAEIGFGGGLTENTFALFGQDINKGAEIYLENLELIQKLWNERAISWSGSFRSPIHDTELEPRTFSGKSIPINRATAGSVETATHAGRSGHRLMLMTAFGNFGDFRHLAEVYRDAYRSSNHDPKDMSVAILAYVHVQKDYNRAREYWRPYIDNYRSFTKALTEAKGMSRSIKAAHAKFATAQTTDYFREADFVGDPRAVIDKISNANAAVGGADRLLCYFDVGGLSQEDTLASMTIFAEQVIPALENL